MSAPRAADPPRWLDGALLALVAAAVFWPVRHFEFLLLDDDHFVTQNPMVRQGLSFDLVAWAFSTTEQGHFQPLTWLSHATDVSLFGLDAGAHHGTNLALHALATALCYLAFTRLTGRRDVGVVTALLYAVHPSRVEVVAWVSERKDLVCACFFFAALASWAAGRRVSTVVFYALALLAKPIALPLPLLLLLDRVAPLSGERRGPLTRRDLVSLAPPSALMLTFAGVAFAAQRGAGAMLSGPHAYEPGRAATHLWTYFARYAWPADVAILHPLKDVAPLTSAVALVALAAALAGCAVLLWRRRDAPLAFAFCAAVALLAPVCGLVQIGAQSTADRWLLLPVAFLTAALARVLPQRARLAVGLVAAAAFAVSTRARSCRRSRRPRRC
ncbi:MAG: hypothetical protein IPJ65_30820 [Archangiaceae bacterium]|nr:hypothetical protein [Archangiaceae bacterium]